ncbi:ATP synthase F1 subcomplex delta subunit [Zhouia amylolytica]|uniref:ATP synthase subunit delta n=2 Tax=Zhouia amylolytica TaxID=376730 RepID=W2UJG1_9FLAO|nr:ATP synthase F1 subunit delta [Zhouia amylolytica]ETN94104.1 ATP synthase subunit D [Zhouia amylolytica AD3]MCQ0112385.1 ATP synthase F1 subunit delta [Zhouia amylolytica]SFS42062.1 ATP synthase F1 subcomplex delta subunit [Zhouia amylolytica]
MAGSRAAIRYAKAILGLATDQNAAAAVNEDMGLIKNTIAGSSDLKALLENPIVKSNVKVTALKEIFKGINTISEGLFDLLADYKRVDILGDIAEKYIILYDEQKGKQVAVVTTAVPLTAELEQKVLAKVKELSGKEITLENKIDESIIGGFILRLGDVQYNASVANKLNSLRRSFSNSL